METNQSFRNESLTGSGTILPDGTYGEPMPDPTEVRGLGADKTSGGRDVAGVRESVPEALIVDVEHSTAAKPDESDTKATTTRTAAKK